MTSKSSDSSDAKACLGARCKSIVADQSVLIMVKRVLTDVRRLRRITAFGRVLHGDRER